MRRRGTGFFINSTFFFKYGLKLSLFVDKFRLIAGCPSGQYGKNCLDTCSENCIVASKCDRFTGQCEGGCKQGWTGTTCDQGKYNQQYNANQFNLAYIQYSPWNLLLYHFPCVHRAVTVHSLAFPAPLRSRSPFTKRSPCAHFAFTLRSFEVPKQMDWSYESQQNKKGTQA